MAPSNLRKALGAVKDQTTISLALVGGSSSLSDLEVAIVKATSHEEYPADERHIREILSLTCYSRSYLGACIATISRRLSKTRNWVVGLKTLMLVQRLLGDGDPAYELEIFFATRCGTRLLNMSDFRDTSRSNSWDYSAFVRTYALYLDERLEVKMQSHRGKRRMAICENDHDEGGPTPIKTTPVRDMSHERLFSRAQQLMQLLERFLACRPSGAAQDNRVVLMALYPVVKESFHIYYDIREILHLLIERFTSLEIADTVKVYEVFSRVSKQFDELDAFYDWCRHAGVARSSEYPEIKKITQKKLEVMDEFIQDLSANKRKAVIQELKEDHEVDESKTVIVEEDMNEIKALPPPEGFPGEEEEKMKADEEEKKEEKATVNEPDLLDLSDSAMTSEQHGDKLALALFDGGAPVGDPSMAIQPWEAYKDVENWETDLVQSASHLANQKASLPGGFDTMVLNGMYQQGAMVQELAASGFQATGSASSVAFGSIGRPAMLALPAPPTAEGGEVAAFGTADPFAASLEVPPPSYVQMSEMEKKQKLLVEEQLLWQQYARDARSGQAGVANLQNSPHPYNAGGHYTKTY